MNGQQSSKLEKTESGRQLNVPLFWIVGLLGYGIIFFVIHAVLYKQRAIQALVSEDQSTLVVISAHHNWNGPRDYLTAWNLNTGQHASYPIQLRRRDRHWWPELELSDNGKKLAYLSTDYTTRILDVYSGRSSPPPKPLELNSNIRSWETCYLWPVGLDVYNAARRIPSTSGKPISNQCCGDPHRTLSHRNPSLVLPFPIEVLALRFRRDT